MPQSSMTSAIAAGLPPTQALQQALASQRLLPQMPTLDSDLSQHFPPLPHRLQALASTSSITSVASAAQHAVSIAAAATPRARTAADAAYFMRQASARSVQSGGAPGGRPFLQRRRRGAGVLSVVAAVTQSDRDGGISAVRRSSRENAPAAFEPAAGRSQETMRSLGGASAPSVMQV